MRVSDLEPEERARVGDGGGALRRILPRGEEMPEIEHAGLHQRQPAEGDAGRPPVALQSAQLVDQPCA